MFTQAQKEAAVEHYRTHDRCISVTMQAQGYSGRATLSALVREAFPEISKAATGRTSRPRYREALKSQHMQADTVSLAKSVSWYPGSSNNETQEQFITSAREKRIRAPARSSATRYPATVA